jgi:hypothetical protein
MEGARRIAPSNACVCTIPIVELICTFVCCTYSNYNCALAPTRHFVVRSRVWFLIVNILVCEAYSLLAPKCRFALPHIIRLPRPMSREFLARILAWQEFWQASSRVPDSIPLMMIEHNSTIQIPTNVLLQLLHKSRRLISPCFTTTTIYYRRPF